MWRTGAAAIAARNLNMTEATTRETKSQGDQVARHPRLLNREGPTGRRRHDLDRETTRKPPQVEAPIPTSRKTSPHCESKDPQAVLAWGAKTEKRNVSLSQCFPKSEGRHHRWNGKWPKKGGKAQQWSQRLRLGTDRNPCIGITSKKIAKLDSCQLHTTVARRNRPVKSRRGLRLVPRGRGKRRTAQGRRNHHAKESLEEARIDLKEIPVDAQGITGTRVAAARYSRRRARQATTHTRSWPIRTHGRLQSPAREGAVTRRSGPEHAEVPPIKERPAVGGRNPPWTTSNDSEEGREDFNCRSAERTGDQQRSPGRQNSKHGTTCGRATND